MYELNNKKPTKQQPPTICKIQLYSSVVHLLTYMPKFKLNVKPKREININYSWIISIFENASMIKFLDYKTGLVTTFVIS